MNLLAILGGGKKNGNTSMLVDKAIEGFQSVSPDSNVKKILLFDYDIKFCKNCLCCMNSETDAPISPCIIRDDMQKLYQYLLDSDRLIFATPVHMGFASGIMTTFLERICWVFAKPEKSYLSIKGCPLPRSDKIRKSIIIITSGIIPPLFRRFCDQATSLIKGVSRDSLNSQKVGDLYAGNVWGRGIEFYAQKSFNLGKKLL